MKVTHLNTSDSGGAGIAARNLHLALLKEGIGSNFVTKYRLGKTTDHHSILPAQRRSVWERVMHRFEGLLGINETPEHYYLKGRKSGFEHFSFPWSDLEPFSSDPIRNAEIIHLHWVSDGFIDYRKIFVPGRKYVWTLHDMNPFTGGCHHSDGCLKFRENCNYSFQLEGTRDEYLSGKILDYKLKALSGVKSEDLIVVAPSRWLAALSQSSALFSRFRHEVIENPNQVHANALDRNVVRSKLGLSEDQVVLLFVSHQLQNPRKGLGMLLRSLQHVQVPGLVVLGMGEKMPASRSNKLVRQLGYISDPQALKEIYTAADAFLLPSLAENFPNTIVESLLCGTPVIASNVGGIPELLSSENGILVAPGDEDAWTKAIEGFILNRNTFNRSAIAGAAAERYNNTTIVKKYIEVYKRLLS